MNRARAVWWLVALVLGLVVFELGAVFTHAYPTITAFTIALPTWLVYTVSLGLFVLAVHFVLHHDRRRRQKRTGER